MPLVNSTPPGGMTEAYSRATPVVVTTNGNESTNTKQAAAIAPAGAGPAAVVSISEAAQQLIAALGSTGGADMPKPGINNETMASEGGNADGLRSLLADRYYAQAARLNEAPA